MSNRRSGLTLVEMVVIVGIAGLIILGVTALVGQGFRFSRQQTEQADITRDALFVVGRMASALENAHDIPGGDWLITRGSYEIAFYTFDREAPPGEVRYWRERYWLEWTVLQREVAQVSWEAGSGLIEQEVTSREVAQFVRNLEEGRPLFEYEEENGEVVAVTIVALIDVVPDRYPDMAEIRQTVRPRLPLWQRKFDLSGGN